MPSAAGSETVSPRLFAGSNLCRFFLIASVVTLLPSVVVSAPAKDLPNIVIIFTDDQGYADVGVFGAKGFQTPNLDRLAPQGRLFRNFYVPPPARPGPRPALP